MYGYISTHIHAYSHIHTHTHMINGDIHKYP
uniref:Uncharacterized protein n=1 Tax=Arundo donax TaxID=35708 RepID=A0A0A9EB76_ARUDO